MDNATSNGKTSLQARLEEPQVLAAMNRLLDRIDSLEETVDTLHMAIKEGPGFAAMVTDMVDDTIRTAAASGIDVEHRAKNALTLAERVTDDKTSASLDQALTLAQEAPGLVAMMADMFDEAVRNAAAEGVDLESRLKGVLQLAGQLTEPGTLEALHTVLGLLGEAPGFVAMVADMADEQIRTAAAEGIDVDARLKGILKLTGRLTDPETTHALEGLLDVNSVHAVGALGQALAHSQDKAPEAIGPMGLWKKLKDPDVQYAMGFLMNVAQHMGRELKAGS